MQCEEDWVVMHALHTGHGWSVSRIAREFDINWRTDRRYATSEAPVRYGPRARPMELTESQLAHVVRRLELCPELRATTLLREVRDLGYEGGTVALAGARAWRTYPSRQVSDHEGQFGERVGETSCRSDLGPEVVETPAEVLDEGVSGDDHPRGSVTLQPSHRSEAGLETPVVGLERIVRMDRRVVEGGREQLTQDAWVDPVPVGGDLGG
jgi:hypothetical protein